jgi:hypothetical protein
VQFITPSQVSTVHGLLSLQVSTPETQPTVALQIAGVQRSSVTKSAHDIKAFTQVALTSVAVKVQESSVQRLLSLQSTELTTHSPVSWAQD